MTAITQIRPDNSQKIFVKGGLATFFTYRNLKGQPCVCYYVGKSAKAKRYSFPTEEKRAEFVERVITNLRATADEKAKRRAEQNKPHNLEKGLILYTSWGYDQTNTEFYEVIKVPSKCYVVLQQIAAPLVGGETDHMSGNRVPNPDNKIGEPLRRKVDMSGSRPSVRICDVVTAWIWDGKEKSVSWYH
ncbi:MAG: hypothetical protein ACRBB0_17865 [Pelagimonas sp.]|uniref:hypothetical protein n=1 Tax=Pelagimonas sp. TaxID=2073170 RepID=UPI003D6B815E